MNFEPAQRSIDDFALGDSTTDSQLHRNWEALDQFRVLIAAQGIFTDRLLLQDALLARGALDIRPRKCPSSDIYHLSPKAPLGSAGLDAVAILVLRRPWKLGCATALALGSHTLSISVF
ncbi:hypothetical protein XH98_20560 [Bradyrhizobium sp. CCBAU 51745]|nr:hypothetical protein [Bradyrhizobium sp. CCBAU 51745]